MSNPKRSKKRRNHFIPRLLLNRFASRFESKPAKFWIYEVRANCPALELSTKDAAVITDFYGKEDSEIEDTFATRIEPRFAHALNCIESGEDPSSYGDELAQFIWLQAIRTQSVRVQFCAAGDRIFDALTDSFATDAAITHLKNQIPDIADEALNEHLAGLPRAERRRRKRELMRSGLFASIQNSISNNVTSQFMTNVASSAFAHARKENVLGRGAADGQIKGLKNLLKNGQVPEALHSLQWSAVKESEQHLVLSDVCVIAHNSSGHVGSVLQVDDWNSLYLPISKTTLLVGSKKGASLSLSFQALNEASARASIRSIYCSVLTPEVEFLKSILGSSTEILTEERLNEIMRDAWKAP